MTDSVPTLSPKKTRYVATYVLVGQCKLYPRDFSKKDKQRLWRTGGSVSQFPSDKDGEIQENIHVRTKHIHAFSDAQALFAAYKFLNDHLREEYSYELALHPGEYVSERYRSTDLRLVRLTRTVDVPLT